MKLPLIHRKRAIGIEIVGRPSISWSIEAGHKVKIVQELVTLYDDGSMSNVFRTSLHFTRDEIETMSRMTGLTVATWIAPSGRSTHDAAAPHKPTATEVPQKPKYLKKHGRCGCALTVDNVIVLGNGDRRCRKHYLAYHKAYNAKKKAERAAKNGGQK